MRVVSNGMFGCFREIDLILIVLDAVKNLCPIANYYVSLLIRVVPIHLTIWLNAGQPLLRISIVLEYSLRLLFTG